jgi:hypothetical protein
MVCRCSKCIAKEEDLERISAIRKLSVEEIYVLNKNKDAACKTALWLGTMLGVLGTITIILEFVFFGWL